MQCRYCGAELPDGCAFCSQCGKPQQTEPAPPAPAAAPRHLPAGHQPQPVRPSSPIKGPKGRLYAHPRGSALRSNAKRRL